MKLDEYKPEIEFMAWDKKNKRFADNFENIYLDEEGNSLIAREGSCCNYVLDNIDVEILPYTNCKDVNNNKLYLFDVVKICNYGNLQERQGIVIFEKCQYKIYVSEKERWNLHLMCDTEDYIERIGSIYELPEIQKQFNIEV